MAEAAMMQISMSLAPQNADDGADSNGCYSGAGGRGFDAAGMADQHARVGNSPFNPRVSFSGTGGAVYSERMMLRRGIITNPAADRQQAAKVGESAGSISEESFGSIPTTTATWSAAPASGGIRKVTMQERPASASGFTKRSSHPSIAAGSTSHRPPTAATAPHGRGGGVRGGGGGGGGGRGHYQALQKDFAQASDRSGRSGSRSSSAMGGLVRRSASPRLLMRGEETAVLHEGEGGGVAKRAGGRERKKKDVKRERASADEEVAERGCQMKDLCEEDKGKIAKLLRQVLELSEEGEKSVAEAEEAKRRAAEADKRAERAEKDLLTLRGDLEAETAKLSYAMSLLKAYQSRARDMQQAMSKGSSPMQRAFSLSSPPAPKDAIEKSVVDALRGTLSPRQTPPPAPAPLPNPLPLNPSYESPGKPLSSGFVPTSSTSYQTTPAPKAIAPLPHQHPSSGKGGDAPMSVSRHTIVAPSTDAQTPDSLLSQPQQAGGHTQQATSGSPHSPSSFSSALQPGVRGDAESFAGRDSVSASLPSDELRRHAESARRERERERERENGTRSVGVENEVELSHGDQGTVNGSEMAFHDPSATSLLDARQESAGAVDRAVTTGGDAATEASPSRRQRDDELRERVATAVSVSRRRAEEEDVADPALKEVVAAPKTESTQSRGVMVGRARALRYPVDDDDGEQKGERERETRGKTARNSANGSQPDSVPDRVDRLNRPSPEKPSMIPRPPPSPTKAQSPAKISKAESPAKEVYPSVRLSAEEGPPMQLDRASKESSTGASASQLGGKRGSRDVTEYSAVPLSSDSHAPFPMGCFYADSLFDILDAMDPPTGKGLSPRRAGTAVSSSSPASRAAVASSSSSVHSPSGAKRGSQPASKAAAAGSRSRHAGAERDRGKLGGKERADLLARVEARVVRTSRGVGGAQEDSRKRFGAGTGPGVDARRHDHDGRRSGSAGAVGGIDVADDVEVLLSLIEGAAL